MDMPRVELEWIGDRFELTRRLTGSSRLHFCTEQRGKTRAIRTVCTARPAATRAMKCDSVPKTGSARKSGCGFTTAPTGLLQVHVQGLEASIHEARLWWAASQARQQDQAEGRMPSTSARHPPVFDTPGAGGAETSGGCENQAGLKTSKDTTQRLSVSRCRLDMWPSLSFLTGWPWSSRCDPTARRVWQAA